MEHVSKLQGEIIQVAINKIASGIVMIEAQPSRSQHWEDTINEALKSLQDIGVPINSICG
jgi:hypothetical protein